MFSARVPVLALSAVLAAGLISAPQPSAASTAIKPIAGERVEITGSVPQKVRRPVVLERRARAGWVRVKTARTTTRGRYAFAFRSPPRSTTYRVVAKRIRVGGTVRRTYVSKSRRVSVQSQRGRLAMPSSTSPGMQITGSAVFAPVRAGRPVVLQALTSGQWRTVATARQSTRGTATFSATPARTTTYRAVASSWKGASAKTTSSRSVTVPATGGAKPWVTGYYAGWFWDQMYPPEKVDMTAMTHFVFGRMAPGAGSIGGQAGQVVRAAGTAHDPGLSPDGVRSVEDYLVKRAHDSGTKALLMLGGDGDDGAGFMLSSTDQKRPTFVKNIVDYLVAHDYDGVDVDWENCLDGGANCGERAGSTPVSAAEARRRLMALLADIRAETATRPRYAAEPALLTFPGYALNINDLDDGKAPRWQADIARVVDQYNLMTYGIGTTWSGGGWLSWFSGALTGASGRTPIDIASSVDAYVAAGVPRSRIGIGIGFYGIYFGPGITGPRQETDDNDIYETQDGPLAYSELIRKGYLSHGSQEWDEAAQSTYRVYGAGGYVPSNDPYATPAGFLSYEDPRSIGAKGEWVRANGVGGTIVWTINYGYLPSTGTNPLLAAVKRSFLE